LNQKKFYPFIKPNTSENKYLKFFPVMNQDLFQFTTITRHLKKRRRILISAWSLFDGKKFKLFPRSFSEIFLDSGAFSMMSSGKKYHYNTKELADFVVESLPTIACPLDFPLHFHDHQTKTKYSMEFAINQTVENTREFFDLTDQVKKEVTRIAVLQGETVEDYLLCYDLLKEQGLTNEKLAIGSLCTRKQTSEIVKILAKIGEETKRKFHAFGVSAAIFSTKYRIHDYLESFDSMSWFYPRKFGRITVFLKPTNRLVELNAKNELTAQEFLVCLFNNYQEYIDFLIQKDFAKAKNTRLDSFLFQNMPKIEEVKT